MGRLIFSPKLLIFFLEILGIFRIYAISFSVLMLGATGFEFFFGCLRGHY